MKPNNSHTYILLFIFLINCNQIISQKSIQSNRNSLTDFMNGVDISALQEIESQGGSFKDNGEPKELVGLFKAHGINYIRIRLWHSPSTGFNNLEKTLEMAKRVKSFGMGLLLDFHYSDTWADPAHQTKPSAWDTLPFENLRDSLFEYNKLVIQKLKEQNTLPDIVQIGNEIGCGLLWEDGKVCGSYNTDEQWTQLAELIKSAITGINSSLEERDSIKIMIHHQEGGNNYNCTRFYNNMISKEVEFDIIGLSFYPWWHGTFADLKINTSNLAHRFNKEIVIVETAYPWTLEWNDNTNNIVGDSSQLHFGYPATVQGQTNYLLDLIEIIKDIPSNNGKGLFYWAPEWISIPRVGSPWENMTLFNFDGELLNSVNVFDSTTTNLNSADIIFIDFRLNQNYPNPFNPTTKISYTVNNTGNVKLVIYDILGEKVKSLVNEFQTAGNYEIQFNSDSVSGICSGIYFYRLVSANNSATKKMLLLK